MRQSDPISILQLYSLDQVLTDQDDPQLWAAAVEKHWPELGSLERRIPRLVFGVGRLPGEKEWRTYRGHRNMEVLELWRLEGTDAGRLAPVRIELDVAWQVYPEYNLHISRPSSTEVTALVHAGSNPAPLIGGGATLLWKRQADGSWIETDQLVSSWET